MNKVVIITITIILLITGALVLTRKKEELPVTYSFDSVEDEQLFRQVIGKPEGDIFEEDILYYLEIGLISYEDHEITKDSINSEDRKINMGRQERTNQEIFDSMIRQSKFNIFLNNELHPDYMIDEYMIQKMLESNQPRERNPDVERYKLRWNFYEQGDVRRKVSKALIKGVNNGDLPQYAEIEDYLELEPEDWRVLLSYWEENLEEESTD